MATKSSRVLCKYYMHGACRYKSGRCAFSHDIGRAPSFACKHYLQGCCVYGDKCRYDHVRPSQARLPGASQPAVQLPPSTTPATNQSTLPAVNTEGSGTGTRELTVVGATGAWSTAFAGGGQAGCRGAQQQWEQQWEGEQGDGGEQQQLDEPWDHEVEEDVGGDREEEGEGQQQQWDNQWGGVEEGMSEQQRWERQWKGEKDGEGGQQQWEEQWAGEEEEELEEGACVVALADRGLCDNMAAYGVCRAGKGCKLVHGDLCEVCHRHVIHPFRADEAQQHRMECRARHDKLIARLRSANMECCICMEKVLSATNPGDRRFGLLSCDHPFCLRCIRTWRTNKLADVDTAVRTCPVCRVTSHFITPSLVWPSTPEEKERVISGYKDKLKETDCQHFRKGEGSCPFGTSCFYRHQYPDGGLEPHEVSLRTTINQRGGVRVVQGVRLSDFLLTDGAQRALGTSRTMRAQRRAASANSASAAADCV